MTARRIAVYMLLLVAALLVPLFVLAPLPAHAQNFRAADQVRLLSAIHIASPWSTYASDVWITNESGDPVSVSITYGASNGPPNPVTKRDVIKLAPRQHCEFIDFLGAATALPTQPPCKLLDAPLTTSGFGQIMFNGCLDGADCRDGTPDAARNYRNISVESRIYSFASAGGPATQTIGQDSPGVPWWSYGDAAHPLKITGIRASAAYRTNIVLVNASDTQPVTLIATLYDGATRAQRDQTRIQFVPFESRQLAATDLFPKLGEWSRLNRTRAAANAYVTITSTEADGGVFAYGSLIDSKSGSPTTLEATFGHALGDGEVAMLFGTSITNQSSEVAAALGETSGFTGLTTRRAVPLAMTTEHSVGRSSRPATSEVVIPCIVDAATYRVLEPLAPGSREMRVRMHIAPGELPMAQAMCGAAHFERSVQ